MSEQIVQVLLPLRVCREAASCCETDESLIGFSADIEIIMDDFDNDDLTSSDDIAGTLEGFIVPQYVFDEPQHLFSEAALLSGQLSDLVRSIWDDSEWEPYLELGLENCGDGLLCFTAMEIKPEYRRQNVGPVVLAEAIEILGCGRVAAVLLAAPMHSDNYTREQFDAACDKLAKHWAQVGFVRNPLYPNYMYLDLAIKRPIPELKELT